MFEHLRVEDRRLFEQLARITAHLAHSAVLLEQLFARPRAASAGIANAVREIGENAIVDDVDVRAFHGFAMRLDRMEYRELAIALDAALEAVRQAAGHADSLDASNAPQGIRTLATVLSGATMALHDAVPHVRREPAEILHRCADLQRLVQDGEAIYYGGVSVLFEGTPDAMHVLRWKAIYDAVEHGLASCGRCGEMLEQLTGAGV